MKNALWLKNDVKERSCLARRQLKNQIRRRDMIRFIQDAFLLKTVANQSEKGRSK